MPSTKLKAFLDNHGVKYVSVNHSTAFTAQEAAASAHIPGKELAKTVIVKLDGKMAMAVLPASYHVDLVRLAEATGSTIAGSTGDPTFWRRSRACAARCWRYGKAMRRIRRSGCTAHRAA